MSAPASSGMTTVMPAEVAGKKPATVVGRDLGAAVVELDLAHRRHPAGRDAGGARPASGPSVVIVSPMVPSAITSAGSSGIRTFW